MLTLPFRILLIHQLPAEDLHLTPNPTLIRHLPAPELQMLQLSIPFVPDLKQILLHNQ